MNYDSTLPTNYWCTQHTTHVLLCNTLEYRFFFFFNGFKRSYQHLRVWHPASDRPEAPRSLLHDRGHKFLQTLQAPTSPPYIRTPRDPRRSFTCCRWLLDRLHVEKRSFINWRELDRVPWSRFGLLLSGWRCNPAAQALSSLYIMEEAQPDSSALCASLLPLTLLQYNNSSRENIMSHHDFMSFTSIIFLKIDAEPIWLNC